VRIRAALRVVRRVGLFAERLEEIRRLLIFTRGVIGSFEPPVDVPETQKRVGLFASKLLARRVLLEKLVVERFGFFEQPTPKLRQWRRVGAGAGRVEARRRQRLVDGGLGQAQILRRSPVLLPRDVG